MMPKMSVSLHVTDISWFLFVFAFYLLVYSLHLAFYSLPCIVSTTKPCYKSNLQLEFNQQRVLFEHLSGLLILVLPIQREQYLNNSQG